MALGMSACEVLDADPVLLQFGVQLAERAQRKEDDVVIGIFFLRRKTHSCESFATPITAKQLPSMSSFFAQRLFTSGKALPR